MFPGFTTTPVTANGITIQVCSGGSGPPVLLLHGYPQTHVMWHQVAPVLARRFTVICPDLRGYGDSGKPSGGPDHEGYSKRVMARDQVAVMAALGFGRFAVAGHDRGARVALRMALDHPEVVSRLAVLVWAQRAPDLRGRVLDCGHFLAEERPAETAAELLAFLTEDRP